MAATVVVVDPGGEGSGNEKIVCFDFTPDTSYPSGGYPLSGLGGPIQAVLGDVKGYVTAWDAATQSLRLYRQTAATSALIEVPPGTDVSGPGVTRLVAIVTGG